jgi:hypothetical protein
MSSPAPRQRTAADIVVELATATHVLHNNAVRWATFLPKPGAIVDAQTCIEGMKRSLAELAAVIGGQKHD